MDNNPELPLNLQYILGYTAAFIFLIGIMLYIYMLIVDNLENAEHSIEESAWIYGFLVILVLGFIISYYAISKSTQNENEFVKKVGEAMNTNTPPKTYKGTGILEYPNDSKRFGGGVRGFGGLRHIPLRPSKSFGHKFRFSKLTI